MVQDSSKMFVHLSINQTINLSTNFNKKNSILLNIDLRLVIFISIPTMVQDSSKYICTSILKSIYQSIYKFNSKKNILEILLNIDFRLVRFIWIPTMVNDCAEKESISIYLSNLWIKKEKYTKNHCLIYIFIYCSIYI